MTVFKTQDQYISTILKIKFYVAKFLNISKSETMELLKKYDIPFIEGNEEYLDHEFNAFN